MSISRDPYQVSGLQSTLHEGREEYVSDMFPKFQRTHFGECLLETEHYGLRRKKRKLVRVESGGYRLVTSGSVARTTIVSPVDPVESKFYDLVEKWQDETGGHSSLTIITTNRHYLRIIGMGPAVIPMILRELKASPAPWFVALQALTGEYEIGKQYPGRFGKIASEWIKWGEDNDLL